MLSFDIRAVASKAAQVDGYLAPDDEVWQEADARPAEPVHVTGRLSTAGAGRFYFSGRFDGVVSGECRRCLTGVSAHVADDVHLLFAETGDEEAGDDPDVYLLDSRAAELDLRPALREEWLLAVPAYAECQPDCKGLCPACGADLNAGPCDCAPATDGRWDALARLRQEPSGDSR